MAYDALTASGAYETYVRLIAVFICSIIIMNNVCGICVHGALRGPLFFYYFEHCSIFTFLIFLRRSFDLFFAVDPLPLFFRFAFRFDVFILDSVLEFIYHLTGNRLGATKMFIWLQEVFILLQAKNILEFLQTAFTYLFAFAKVADRDRSRNLSAHRISTNLKIGAPPEYQCFDKWQ